MHTRSEDLGFGQNTDTPDTIELHFNVWIAIWIAKICKMWTPRSVFRISLHNNSIFVEGIGKGQSRLGFLPGVEIVRLFAP